jgi:hypothetical protein
MMGMVFVTSIISSQEWIRLRDAAQQFFPNEVLARGEILRRFSLSGVPVLKAATDAEKKKAHWEHHGDDVCYRVPIWCRVRGLIANSRYFSS